jgi:hypothetical protein
MSFSQPAFTAGRLGLHRSGSAHRAVRGVQASRSAVLAAPGMRCSSRCGVQVSRPATGWRWHAGRFRLSGAGPLPRARPLQPGASRSSTTVARPEVPRARRGAHKTFSNGSRWCPRVPRVRRATRQAGWGAGPGIPISGEWPSARAGQTESGDGRRLREAVLLRGAGRVPGHVRRRHPRRLPPAGPGEFVTAYPHPHAAFSLLFGFRTHATHGGARLYVGRCALHVGTACRSGTRTSCSCRGTTTTVVGRGRKPRPGSSSCRRRTKVAGAF